MWVANVAGPTMFLNMDRKQFGDIQARLFPKFGMLGVGSGIAALASYHVLHPEPTTMTYILAASATSHLLQSFIIFPYVTKYQYKLRQCPEGKNIC